MHAEWPISLELEGTYHNLGLFLDRVSKFPRIINVGGLDIEGKQQPQPNATDRGDVHGDDVRAARQRRPPRRAKKGAGGAEENRMRLLALHVLAVCSRRASARCRADAARLPAPPRQRRAAAESAHRRRRRITPTRPDEPARSVRQPGQPRHRARARRRPGARPEGIAGILVEKSSSRGIVQSRGGWVAMIGAPNGRTYTDSPRRSADGRQRPRDYAARPSC